MRYLGIDFGEKRIGLAVSDDRGCIASPLRTLTRKSDAAAIHDIVTLARQEDIGAVVIGEPRGPEGVTGDAAARVRNFARKLRSAATLPVLLTDETLTSREAEHRLSQSRGRGDRVDAVAAQIILQQALDEPSSATPLDEPA